MKTDDTHTPGAFQINSLGALVWEQDTRIELDGIADKGGSLFFFSYEPE